MTSPGILAIVTTLAATTGCGGVVCGEGTFDNGDNCSAFDPNDTTPPVVTLTPAGKRSRDPLPPFVMITTDEPARIFFTVDGSDPDPTTGGQTSPATVPSIPNGATLKYLAVDRAGNQGAIESSTYDSDTTPPAGVKNLAINVTGTSAMVTWTNPTTADYLGTMIARISDLADADPDPGTIYQAPSALSSSLQVVQVGTGSQLADVNLTPGPARYAVWTFDDLGNYSAPTIVRGDVALGSLATQFTFQATGSVLTQTITTPHLDLTGTTAALNGTTLTLSLSVKNLTLASFINPKQEVTSLTGGSFSNSAGNADGNPFATLGPNALGPGMTGTKDLTITGVAANSTVTINLLLAQHPSILATRQNGGNHSRALMFSDSATGQLIPFEFAASSLGRNGNPGQIRKPVIIGEHFLDIPTAHGQIERWDMRTQTRVAGVQLDPNRATGPIAILGAVVTGTGHEIVLIKNGKFRNRGSIELIRLDEALHRTGSLVLDLAGDRGNSFSALSADGKVLAVVGAQEIALVDPESMTQLDADPTTSVIDTIRIPITDHLRAAEFFGGSTGLLALSKPIGQSTSGQVATIHLSTTAAPTVTVSTNFNSRGHALARASDGRIWIAFENFLRVFDPANDSIAATSYPSGTNGVTVANGQLFVVRNDRNNVDQINNAGAVQRTFTFGSQLFAHWVAATR